MLSIRDIGCLPTWRAPEGSTAEFLRLTKQRGVKLFRDGYTLAHVSKEAEIMLQAAKLGLCPKVYGLVRVKDGDVERYGIEVQVIHVITSCAGARHKAGQIERLRARIKEKMGLLAVDVRCDNVGILPNGRLVCIDWSLARLIPVDRATKLMRRAYLTRPLNYLSSVSLKSLAPNDPYIGVSSHG